MTISVPAPLGIALTLCALVTVCNAHGFMSDPRIRGSLKSQRDIPNPVIDPAAPIDYCPHCLNCGGVGTVMKGGDWDVFAPFDYKREGITLCGDPVGNDDHFRSGIYANPPSTPYVANYAPGSVANFEYDVTAHHNGFLTFYLCDVSSTGDVVNTVEFFKDNCYELERSPHPDCEAGTEMDCGPIDPKYPGRWVLPCKDGSTDQIFGGPNGKMAYKIPDVTINDGVIVSYWLTQNTCNSPDGFMDDYDYPSVWGSCPGDGGTRGARPTFKDCKTTGQVPEEFFNCADVQVGGDGKAPARTPTRAPEVTEADDAEPSSAPVTTDPSVTVTTSPDSTEPLTTKATESGATTSSITESKASPLRPKYPGSQDLSKNCDPVVPIKPETPEEASNPEGTCSLEFKQCGGLGWEGPTTCCDSSYICVTLNEFYHQCLTVPTRPNQYGSMRR